jgi:hypothetical protein
MYHHVLTRGFALLKHSHCRQWCRRAFSRVFIWWLSGTALSYEQYGRSMSSGRCLLRKPTHPVLPPCTDNQLDLSTWRLGVQSLTDEIEHRPGRSQEKSNREVVQVVGADRSKLVSRKGGETWGLPTFRSGHRDDISNSRTILRCSPHTSAFALPSGRVSCSPGPHQSPPPLHPSASPGPRGVPQYSSGI